MATRYWVGGGASTNWSATGSTNWSAISGGSNNASVPTTGDDVVFNGSSGSSTSILDQAISLNSFDCNAYTGTITHNAVTLTITGNDAGAIAGVTFRLASGMTFTAGSNARLVSMTSTSGTSTITTAGKTLGALTLNGVGGTFSLGDDLTVRSDAAITLTNGTFTDNNHNVTAGAFSSANSNTRVVTFGTGTAWTLGLVSGTVFDCSTVTGLTVNPGTATITCSAAATGNRIFACGTSKSYPGLAIVDSGTVHADFTITATTAATFASLAMTAPVNVVFPQAVTVTVTAAFALAGTAYNSAILLRSSNAAAGVQATISTATGSPTIAWAALDNMAFTGGATFTATNSIDLGHNTGISISGPTGGGATGVIGS